MSRFCPKCGTRAADDAQLCSLCAHEYVLGAAARRAAVHHVTLAGFWRRCAALLLDTLVLLFPGAIIRVLLGISSTGFDNLDSTNGWIATLLEVALDGLYAAVLMSSRAGATLGMQVMGLRITTVEGRPVSFGRALARFLALAFTFLTFGIGYLMQVFTRSSCAWAARPVCPPIRWRSRESRRGVPRPHHRRSSPPRGRAQGGHARGDAARPTR
jgi:uncharacterized RDD family membrane protein YckC